MSKTTTYKNTAFSLKSLIQDKSFLWIIKLAVIGVLLYILYQQLFGREDLTLLGLWKLLQGRISTQNNPLLLAVLLLMPLNWLFETRKWILLMQHIQSIPLKAALKGVLTGVTVSLFTPNRVGEYGGRILLVEAQKRYQAVLASGVGILSQWVVLLLGGWWAMLLAFSLNLLAIQPLLFTVLTAIGLLLTAFLLFSYYRLHWLGKQLSRISLLKKWTKKWQNTLAVQYDSTQLNQILWHSVLRYSTYSFQYFLLLYFFGLELTYLPTLLGILIIYLLQTGIPLPPSTGLLARGNIAIFIFTCLSSPNNAVATTVLAATFSLWIINVLLPALIGAILLIQIQPRQKEA